MSTTRQPPRTPARLASRSVNAPSLPPHDPHQADGLQVLVA